MLGAHDLLYDGDAQKGTEFASRMQGGEFHRQCVARVRLVRQQRQSSLRFGDRRRRQRLLEPDRHERRKRADHAGAPRRTDRLCLLGGMERILTGRPGTSQEIAPMAAVRPRPLALALFGLRVDARRRTGVSRRPTLARRRRGGVLDRSRFQAAVIAAARRVAGDAPDAVSASLLQKLCSGQCPPLSRSAPINRLEAASDTWSLQVLGDGTAARYRNMEVGGRERAIAKEKPQRLSAESLYKAGRTS